MNLLKVDLKMHKDSTLWNINSSYHDRIPYSMVLLTVMHVIKSIFKLLAPGRFELNFQYMIFKLILIIDGSGMLCEIAHRILLTISQYCLVPSSNTS